jgi:hypothetical protein
MATRLADLATALVERGEPQEDGRSLDCIAPETADGSVIEEAPVGSHGGVGLAEQVKGQAHVRQEIDGVVEVAVGVPQVAERSIRAVLLQRDPGPGHLHGGGWPDARLLRRDFLPAGEPVAGTIEVAEPRIDHGQLGVRPFEGLHRTDGCGFEGLGQARRGLLRVGHLRGHGFDQEQAHEQRVGGEAQGQDDVRKLVGPRRGIGLVENLDLPAETMRVLTVLLLLGFPVVVVLAWIFDVTTGGIVRTEPLEGGSSPSRPSSFSPR